jgi:hypothetical protein
MSLSLSWMACCTFSTSSSARRVSSCFRISWNTCARPKHKRRQEGVAPVR